MTWTLPFVLLTMFAVVARFNRSYEDAATDCGANAWQRVRHVSVPLLRPFIAVAVALRAVDALKAFDTIFVITGGGPGTSSETLNLYLYQTAFAYYDIGYASAIVVVFFVLILLVTFVLLMRRAQAATQ